VSSKVHLDVLSLCLTFMDDIRVHALASISCNWLVWSPHEASCFAFTPILVREVTCPLTYHIFVDCEADFPSNDERRRFSFEAIDVSGDDKVRELRWKIQNTSEEITRDISYLSLRHLGELESLRLEVLSEDVADGIAAQLVDSLSPPPCPKLYLQIHDFSENNTDVSELRSTFAPYIRKHEGLVEFDLLTRLYDHDCDPEEEQLREELGDLARDNAWLGLIRNNPTASLHSLLQGIRRRPSVLHFALKQRISELY